MAETPLALQEVIGLPAGGDALEILREGQLTLERTHPIVQAVAAHTLDQALDADGSRPIAARSAAIRTRAVQHRTSLLLARMRFHLTLRQGNRPEHKLLAEEAHILAFAGQPDSPDWLDTDAAEQLLAAAAGREHLSRTGHRLRQPSHRRPTSARARAEPDRQRARQRARRNARPRSRSRRRPRQGHRRRAAPTRHARHLRPASAGGE